MSLQRHRTSVVQKIGYLLALFIHSTAASRADECTIPVFDTQRLGSYRPIHALKDVDVYKARYKSDKSDRAAYIIFVKAVVASSGWTDIQFSPAAPYDEHSRVMQLVMVGRPPQENSQGEHEIVKRLVVIRVPQDAEYVWVISESNCISAAIGQADFPPTIFVR
jgi:hypothetical protein